VVVAACRPEIHALDCALIPPQGLSLNVSEVRREYDSISPTLSLRSAARLALCVVRRTSGSG
jgi:hypothetical protein